VKTVNLHLDGGNYGREELFRLVEGREHALISGCAHCGRPLGRVGDVSTPAASRALRGTS
jgi:hypothetical protein